MNSTDTMIEITVCDDAGNVVEHGFSKAFTASKAEIDAIVALIEGGMPAHMASTVILSERS